MTLRSHQLLNWAVASALETLEVATQPRLICEGDSIPLDCCFRVRGLSDSLIYAVERRQATTTVCSHFPHTYTRADFPRTVALAQEMFSDDRLCSNSSKVIVLCLVIF